MEKINVETFYFQMDCNYLVDPKIQILFQELGYCALSIYFNILCWIYLEKGVLTKKHYRYISNQLKCDEDIVKKIVEDYELFIIEGDEFSSQRIREDMEKRFRMSEGGKKSRKR